MSVSEFDPVLVRADWVPRLRLATRILRQLERRHVYLEGITSLPHSDLPVGNGLELERLSRAWMLVDNLLGVYAMVAYQLNARTDRIAISQRLREEAVPPSREFLERAWLWSSLPEALSSGAVRPLGVTPEEYLRRLQPLTDRTLERLTDRYTRQRRFHEQYAPFAMAHRHGRAAFHLRVEVTEGPPVHIKLRHDSEGITVLRRQRSERPVQVHTLLFDQEYQDDVAAVLHNTSADIRNYSRLLAALEAGMPDFLDAIERGATGTTRGRLPYILLAAPYTADEQPIANNFTEGE